MIELAGRVLPVLGFLVCITVVADLADRAGVFDLLARWAVRLARGRVVVLWLLVVVVATVSVAVLSLDTAAVLITPVVIVVARLVRADPRPFAWTTVWLANTASLFLPVSNLSNLIAMSHLGLDVRGFVALLWLPAVVAVVITTAVLAVVFRRELFSGGRIGDLPEATPRDRVLLVGVGVTCAALVPALAGGVDVTLASAVAALVCVLLTLVRQPGALSLRMIPWLMTVGVAVLFVVVEVLHRVGALTWLITLAGSGDGWVALLRLGAVAALGANVINNLPAYLAVEPAGTDPVRTAAILVGVNTGPVITPWGSLATLLWAGRCRAAGLAVDWAAFVRRGLVLVPLLLVGCVTALWLLHGR